MISRCVYGTCLNLLVKTWKAHFQCILNVVASLLAIFRKSLLSIQYKWIFLCYPKILRRILTSNMTSKIQSPKTLSLSLNVSANFFLPTDLFQPWSTKFVRLPRGPTTWTEPPEELPERMLPGRLTIVLYIYIYNLEVIKELTSSKKPTAVRR